MLQALNDGIKGWLAWVIVILLSIPFALWGVHEFTRSDSRVVVASVGDAEITDRELNRAWLNYRQHLQQILGDAFRSDLFDEQLLRREVLDDLIENEVLRQAAHNAGMRVSDVQMASELRAVEAFHENGQFSRRLYESILFSQGMTPELFERDVRRSLLQEQLRAGVAATAFVTAAERDQLLRLAGQQREVGYLVLPLEDEVARVEFSEAALADFFERNREQFRIGERVVVEYLELSTEALAADGEVDEETLRDFYIQRRAEFVQPERRRAAHILVETADQAEALLERIEAGESFAALAEAYSQDPGSAREGGDLGWFGPGEMVGPFEDAVFALAEGEVTGPVATEFGYHVIQLQAVQAERGRGFDEVRDQLAQEWLQRQAEGRFFDRVETLANLAFEEPDSLLPAADALGLELRTSEPFSRAGGDGIARHGRVVEAAFSDEVLERGMNSEVIELGPDRMVAVRVVERMASRLPELDEVREAAAEQWRREEASTALEIRAERIRERLEAGESASAVAAEHGVAWRELGAVGRDGRDARGTPAGVLRAAFALEAPREGRAAYTEAWLPAGDKAVVEVARVIDGDPAAIGAREAEQMIASLREAQGQARFGAVTESLRGRTSVRIHERQLEQR